MSNTDNITTFNTVDRQADPRYFIRFLDAGRAVEGIQQIKRAIRSQLALHEGLRVLDVGCGTGEDVYDLVQDMGATGEAVGVDVSGIMIAEAKARHAASGRPLRLITSDAHDLSFAESTFDRCRIDRTLMHLHHPEQALAEIVRVLRPGGKVMVFDFDWGTTFVDSPYEIVTRKVIDAFSHQVQHGWIGRALPRLCRVAGLTELTCVPHAVYIPYSIAQPLFAGVTATLQTAGEVSGDDLTRWWQYLAQAESEGHCHIGQLGFIVSGIKRSVPISAQ